MKTPVYLLLLAALLTGCGTLHRVDGGRTAEFAEDGGTEIVGPSVQVGGSLLSLFSFQKREKVKRTGDEPSIAAGNSIGSKAAMEAMSGGVLHSNGVKHVTFGAKGITTEAQKIDSILQHLHNLTPEGQLTPGNPD